MSVNRKLTLAILISTAAIAVNIAAVSIFVLS